MVPAVPAAAAATTVAPVLPQAFEAFEPIVSKYPKGSWQADDNHEAQSFAQAMSPGEGPVGRGTSMRMSKPYGSFSHGDAEVRGDRAA